MKNTKTKAVSKVDWNTLLNSAIYQDLTSIIIHIQIKIKTNRISNFE